MISGLLYFRSFEALRRLTKGLRSDARRQPSLTPAIFVDVTVIRKSDSGTGIQRVVRALYRQLLEGAGKRYSVVPIFATRYTGYRRLEANFLDRPYQAREAIGKITVRPGDLFLGLDLAAHVIPRHRRQILRWKRQGLKIHLVVYDLLPITRPEWFNPKLCSNFRKWTDFLEHHADGAICISRHVRNELKKILDRAGGSIRGPKLTTIRLGADIGSSLPSAGISPEQRIQLDRIRSMKPILMVGTLEPRKGHEDALSAFEQIWKSSRSSDIALVIVGRPGWQTEALEARLSTHAEQGSRLFWFSDASDELLESLYEVSEGVLVASFDEGFGLPVIEAAHHNKKILARDIAVFREIAPSWACFFDGEGRGELSDAILAWIREPPESYRLFKDRQATWHDAHHDLLKAMTL